MLAIPRKLVLLALAAAALTACQSMEVQQLPDNADPTAEINKLEAARNAAFAQHIDSMSPTNWGEANAALDEAKRERDRGADAKDILAQVSIGTAYLKKANDNAKITDSAMHDVIAARQAAVAAKAPDLLRNDFDATERDYKAATAKIEAGNLTVAENTRSELTKRFAAIELKAIKQGNLGHAVSTINQANNEGAEDWAPRSLGQAKAKVKEAEAFIDQNRHDTAGIQARAAQATAAADQLLTVTRGAKVAQKTDAESLVLQQQQAAAQLAAEKAAADKVGADKAALEASSSATTAKLQSENSQLAAQQAFQAKYDAARARFTADEAEVLRQGDNLLIRMKGLDFASGKAAIPPKNFALLNKAVATAKDLGAAKVTVEGHTDAVGAKKANEKLSTDRAEAVLEYLAANGIDRAAMSSVGYGDTRPLATSKTKEGRAQNRRVDIIVQPAAALTAH